MKRLILSLIMFVTVPFLWSYAAVPDEEVPNGFILTVRHDGLERPVDTEVLPDGSLLVAEKGEGEDGNGRAHVKWIREGQAIPVLELSVHAQRDSGILGIIPDPDFADNQQFYVWYAGGVDALGYDEEPSVRLSRFTLNMEAEQAEDEQIIFDLGAWNELHIGGGLAFDDEGDLYIGIGDLGEWRHGQDMNRFQGKVLRIRPTDDGYTVPPDNPFVDDDDPKTLAEIYAAGLRNPFRMTRNSAGQIFVTDVGLSQWEEVNLLEAGANYGWAVREGVCPVWEPLPCPAADPKFTDPYLVYPHVRQLVNDRTVDIGSVTAVTFYEGTVYPPEYHNVLFLTDFVLSWIKTADLETRELLPFSDTAGIVDATYHDDQILLTQYHTGIIYALEHTGEINNYPIVSLNVDETFGAAPLEVTFEATPFDADGEEMTLLWDFGDGTPPISGEVGEMVVTHTYMTDGVYTPVITVTDEQGGATNTTEQITVYSGELPHIQVDNVTDSERERYWAGDGVRMTAVRSTTDDLAEIPYTWEIDLHHNIHKHSLFSGINAADYSFFIPTENHDGDWVLWYEFRLTMHTADGLDITFSEQFLPEYVDLTFTADAPVTLTVNRSEQRPPHTFRSIVGVENQIIVPTKSISPAGFFGFNGWNTGGGVVLDIVAPAIETTWIANYTFDSIAHPLYVPMLVVE